MKILEKEIKFTKIVYRIELESAEKYWPDSQIVSALNEPGGFPVVVHKFENRAEVVFYMD